MQYSSRSYHVEVVSLLPVYDLAQGPSCEGPTWPCRNQLEDCHHFQWSQAFTPGVLLQKPTYA